LSDFNKLNFDNVGVAQRLEVGELSQHGCWKAVVLPRVSNVKKILSKRHLFIVQPVDASVQFSFRSSLCYARNLPDFVVERERLDRVDLVPKGSFQNY